MSSASYPLHVPVFLEYSAAAGASDGASGRTVGTLLPSPAPFLIFVSSSSQRPLLNNVRIINTSSASAASLKVTPLTPSEMKQHGVSASMASSVIHGFDPTTMPLPRLDRDKAEARLARNVARITKMSANFNENVSDEAQSVFDALSRTMECAWEGDRILVRVSGVIIDPPYKPENAKLVDKDGDKRAVERMQLVLRRTRETLNLPL